MQNQSRHNYVLECLQRKVRFANNDTMCHQVSPYFLEYFNPYLTYLLPSDKIFHNCCQMKSYSFNVSIAKVASTAAWITQACHWLQILLQASGTFLPSSRFTCHMEVFNNNLLYWSHKRKTIPTILLEMKQNEGPVSNLEPVIKVDPNLSWVREHRN